MPFSKHFERHLAELSQTKYGQNNSVTFVITFTLVEIYTAIFEKNMLLQIVSTVNFLNLWPFIFPKY